MTSAPPPQPTNDNAPYQWAGGQDTSQVQSKYGYNYHHIDQRTENPYSYAYSSCGDPKPDSQQETSHVYAEFTTDPPAVQYTSERPENYFETGANPQCSPDDTRFKYQTKAEHQHESGRSHAHNEMEDHAQYVSKGYVDVLSRWAVSHSNFSCWVSFNFECSLIYLVCAIVLKAFLTGNLP